MVAGLDRNEHGDAEPDLLRIDQRDAARDDAVGLQPLQPLPARRRRQADTLADFGDGQRGVLLDDGEDLSVDGIHALGPRRNVEQTKPYYSDNLEQYLF